MNEIEIYNLLYTELQTIKKEVNLMWKFIAGWVFYSSVLLIFTKISWLFAIVVFIPLIPIIFFLIRSLRNELQFGKKVPIFYNNIKKYNKNFVSKIERYANTRKQLDPNHIKIDNYGLEYIDKLINTYRDDRFKLANALYNGIDDTNLVDELKFFKKYKDFIKDMDNCRFVLW